MEHGGRAAADALIGGEQQKGSDAAAQQRNGTDGGQGLQGETESGGLKAVLL